jgi:hypothetical protein
VKNSKLDLTFSDCKELLFYSVQNKGTYVTSRGVGGRKRDVCGPVIIAPV